MSSAKCRPFCSGSNLFTVDHTVCKRVILQKTQGVKGHYTPRTNNQIEKIGVYSLDAILALWRRQMEIALFGGNFFLCWDGLRSVSHMRLFGAYKHLIDQTVYCPVKSEACINIWCCQVTYQNILAWTKSVLLGWLAWCQRGPNLLTWFNFNPDMDKWSQAQ